ncbi:uncharacterized protein TEOVI_000161300 [Trypanosoma equiperdum]|uniref:Uncharacterized protein n=4 Tax=Trypanozoon TaxID=39700 RepID=Q385U5_TRYB2|nr:hypothetical protein, conserved [Trypanosoma brucei gambiense DAL972]XP_828548.1 hypothetical protein, conserved [Trypanosoma brucei brucei TREU927]RHW67058.1 hypothetical protein DPX39_000057600 [Trypanosoma brucei equiperdum]SCU70044.1 hypothetical protein, conserved [Trypanosoma equiperdum]EAN79436.1 hypothetical protein, conserved [Trypanosoma brucei brucei TREU927]CBH17418.1 hypothetical protein, conserved [Trypanosoma brucei gambiense DAL972]|eukprot:XP_011779682.1 hypothetical protein, conserved [Trypanosoma brucei gambiense DAL972]
MPDSPTSQRCAGSNNRKPKRVATRKADGGDQPLAVNGPSSPECIRTRTQKLEKELRELVLRNRSRHERLQNMRNRATLSSPPPSGPQSFERAARPSDESKPRSETEGRNKLPNLYKCFDEARTKSLLEYEKNKGSKESCMYSSYIPRDADLTPRGKQRDAMKDPDSFSLRFCSKLHPRDDSR